MDWNNLQEKTGIDFHFQQSRNLMINYITERVKKSPKWYSSIVLYYEHVPYRESEYNSDTTDLIIGFYINEDQECVVKYSDEDRENEELSALSANEIYEIFRQIDNLEFVKNNEHDRGIQTG